MVFVEKCWRKQNRFLLFKEKHFSAVFLTFAARNFFLKLLRDASFYFSIAFILILHNNLYFKDLHPFFSKKKKRELSDRFNVQRKQFFTPTKKKKKKNCPVVWQLFWICSTSIKPSKRWNKYFFLIRPPH